ncbi:MAG TPA: heavy metal translocating P-type ATPase [Polaromonas sp.]|uniref:heavy metal translocating P-type ATPase n=1 Tax=Polaromonas sp. TaxID=1869339 RepID=UPI002D4AEE3B|nr:heavy metal translocating P-type ATPase [Polaromonas sp.]HYW58051.1 heavy metal translocating P-type ATPase [Polaromonas sp.]
MQAAVLSPQLAGLRSHLPEGDALARFSLLDDVSEWSLFSRPLPEPHDQAAASSLWESQVAVRGMHCAACSLQLEHALLATPGVVSVQVSAASQRASVVWSAAQTKPSVWLTAPLAVGYRLLPASDAFAPDPERKESRLALWRWLVAGFCMMQVMMYAFPAYIAGPDDITPDIQNLLRWASWMLSLPVILFSCRPFFSNALRDLRRRSISMDLPVALGITITFAISSAATFDPRGWWGQEVYFDSLTMFVFFLLSGRWLEQRLRDRTAGSLESLMQRLPDSVERQGANGTFERIAVRRLAAGDLIRVLPGEAFPADGSIVSGETSVDEALLTGESRPLVRLAGEAVIAGSYNLSAAVQVRVEQIGPSTRYAQIVALMQRASVDKPRLALLADRVAKPFLWFVLLAAAMAAAVWWSTDPARALMAAVAVLVVTCPCALSLATPVAMLSSAGFLARRGVLVRRLQALESLAAIDTVIFDKTGTLTTAQVSLRDVSTREGIAADQALQLAAAMARHSRHPVSRALVAAAEGAPAGSGPAFDAQTLIDVQEFPGQGLQASLTASPMSLTLGRVRLGSARFCDAGDSLHDTLQVFLADESGWLARFDLEEATRSDAAEIVAALQAAGADVQILSGDRAAVARQIAEQLGIKSALGDCTPQAKLDHLHALQRKGRKVLMVGDGLNDGPVLASAHVSVAVGGALPLAQAQSDFVLPGEQLLMLPVMLAHARRTMQVVRQNLCWAALYNAACVPLALAGWLPAWLAGLGMALSSLLVIANASRLAHVKGRT